MRTPKLVALAALAVVAGLTLAACGDDEDNTGSAATETTAAAPADTSAAAEAMKDIVDTAVAAGNFTTLATALTEAGLIETLKGEGPFTVFAPTDEAFAAVPKETLDALLANKEALTSVLTYHVVPGKVLAADVTAGDVPTVQGATIAITTDGGVKVNDANVIATDVMASNGVIHVIDAVILPPDLEL